MLLVWRVYLSCNMQIWSVPVACGECRWNPSKVGVDNIYKNVRYMVLSGGAIS